jgi:hypothetical protein
VSLFTDEFGHLMAFDATGKADHAELHAFAKKLKLRLDWYQEAEQPWLCHYDLTTPQARRRAIAAGATKVTIHEMGERIQRARGREQCVN